MLNELLALIAPPLCVACGGDAAQSAPLCVGCRRAMRPLTAAAIAGAWAAFPYDGPAGALVRSLKFGGRVAIADVMAAQIAAHAPRGLLDGAFVPVPVHPRHRRRRGLDHALLIAEALARRTGLAVIRCLERGGDPRAQVGRGRRERLAGVAGSIAVAHGIDVPARAVVVDDVVTTGSTIRACAAALGAAGCPEIAAIAYARSAGR
jgi:predicted amidophosphoribosyltransferase